MSKDHKSLSAKRKMKPMRAGALVSKQIRGVAEKRGFAHARLLTEWEAIVGPEIARLATPLKVGYGSRSLGATLHLTVRPAAAPEVQMQEQMICERVNTCYGYNAVRKIRIVSAGIPPQPLQKSRLRRKLPVESADFRTSTQTTLEDVKDPGLRKALEDLGSSIRTEKQSPKEST